MLPYAGGVEFKALEGWISVIHIYEILAAVSKSMFPTYRRVAGTVNTLHTYLYQYL
jgi:hypothetical protein